MCAYDPAELRRHWFHGETLELPACVSCDVLNGGDLCCHDVGGRVGGMTAVVFEGPVEGVDVEDTYVF